jgi:hypothetical protein
MVNLNLRICSSSSNSTWWMRSAHAKLGVHFASGSMTGPTYLMLKGRLGKVCGLECINISFWSSFSLNRTGQILTLKGYLFAGAEIPKDIK